MLPKNTTVLASILPVALAVAWIAGLGWWSFPAALLAALVLSQIYHRLTLTARLQSTRDNAEWSVLYREGDGAWQTLVGGERCTRREAETCRRGLERRGYLTKIVSRESLSGDGLPATANEPARAEPARRRAR